MLAVEDKDAVTGNGHENQGQPGAETRRDLADREISG